MYVRMNDRTKILTIASEGLVLPLVVGGSHTHKPPPKLRPLAYQFLHRPPADRLRGAGGKRAAAPSLYSTRPQRKCRRCTFPHLPWSHSRNMGPGGGGSVAADSARLAEVLSG